MIFYGLFSKSIYRGIAELCLFPTICDRPWVFLGLRAGTSKRARGGTARAYELDVLANEQL